MKFPLVWLAGAGLVCTACNTPQPRLNAPPHGQTTVPHEMQSVYTHMIDSALLEDMCVSDIHFIPHRALLSPLGKERLSRLASLMKVYGGEIRFDTQCRDPDLTQRRIDCIVDYLCEAGIEDPLEVVHLALPGGRGMDASEAILIKASEATYQPGKSKQSGSFGQGQD